MSNIETKELLEDCGREVGGGLLESAVLNAQNGNQLSNQVQVIEFSAVHILAVCAFNNEVFQDQIGNDYIDDICDRIKEELEYIKTHGMDAMQIPDIRQ